MSTTINQKQGLVDTLEYTEEMEKNILGLPDSLEKEVLLTQLNNLRQSLRDSQQDILSLLQGRKSLLIRHQKELSMVIESSNDGIIVLDSNLRVNMYNPAAEKLFGRSASAMHGNSLKSIIPEEYRKEFDEAVVACFETVHTSTPILIRIEGLHSNGHLIPIEISFSLGRVNGDTFILADIRDISKTLENESLQQQFLVAQKMEALGLLAGGIAHDFNNILQAIIGNTQLLDDEFPNNEIIQEILDASELGRRLVKLLLAYSRKQVLEKNSVNINQVIQDLFKNIGRLLGEDITLQLDLKSEHPVFVDISQMNQLILNIAVNARDAMPNGGKLDITTRSVCLAQKDCKEIQDAYPGDFVCIEITDNGIGMDPKILERIYEPLYTTKESGKGTGLGLAAVLSILKQHDSFIQTTSSPQKGATFRIYIPVSQKPVSRELVQKKSLSLDLLKGNGEKILLVEDDVHIEKWFKKLLPRYNYNPVIVSSYEEGMKIFQEEGPFDLVISDVILSSERNGYELVRELRKIAQELPIIMTSGYSDEKSQQDNILQEGLEFLPKPYNTKALLKKIKGVVDLKHGE